MSAVDDARTVEVLVRLRPGVVGETRRVCHVVPVQLGGSVPEFLTAYCGLRIEAGTADLLDGPTGMPCVPCLVRMPLPGPSPEVRG